MKNTKRISVLILAVSLILIFAAGCQRQETAPRLRLQVTAPSSRATVSDSSVTVSGIVSDAAAEVAVMDIPASVDSDGSFSAEVPLAYGENRVSVRATVADQSPITRTLTVTRNLVLEVDSPEDMGIVDEDLINVMGRVSDIAAVVLVNGIEAAVQEDGSFSLPLELYYPTTTVNITTQLDGVDPISRMVTVSRQAN